jgi:hypothetical protein
MGEIRNTYKMLVGKLEMKRPLGRPSSRWEDNITMDLKEIQWEDVDWIHMAQDGSHWWGLVNTVMNLQFP